MSLVRVDEALEKLNSLKKQNIPQTEDKAHEYFETYANILQTILQKNRNSKLEIAAEIRYTIEKIISTCSLSTTEKILDLYMSQVEYQLSEIVSDRFLAGRLWSADENQIIL